MDVHKLFETPWIYGGEGDRDGEGAAFGGVSAFGVLAFGLAATIIGGMLAGGGGGARVDAGRPRRMMWAKG